MNSKVIASTSAPCSLSVLVKLLAGGCYQSLLLKSKVGCDSTLVTIEKEGCNDGVAEVLSSASEPVGKERWC